MDTTFPVSVPSHKIYAQEILKTVRATVSESIPVSPELIFYPTELKLGNAVYKTTDPEHILSFKLIN